MFFTKTVTTFAPKASDLLQKMLDGWHELNNRNGLVIRAAKGNDLKQYARGYDKALADVHRMFSDKVKELNAEFEVQFEQKPVDNDEKS